MCNQTVCLIAAELERQGISTVVIQLLRSVAEQVQPPRALAVPFRHGFPLGQPDEPELQHKVIRAALELLNSSEVNLPHIVDFQSDEAETSREGVQVLSD
jgi:hypothetical protein